ncbi:MAG: ferritin-like domain-containing protein [candidate division WOR-3 bacterium]
MSSKEELLKLMNDAVARELQVAIQYMWQHVRASGYQSPPIADAFKKIAITEMKHAEAIAERMDYLGGEATTKPAPITVGQTLKEMLELDIKAEGEAITLYKRIIDAAQTAKDTTTRRLFEEILADEEEHDDLFRRLLEGL